jgi:hypothetical protein
VLFTTCYEGDEIKKHHVAGHGTCMADERNVYRILIGIPEWKKPCLKWVCDLSFRSVSQCSVAAYKKRVLSHKKYLAVSIVVVWLFQTCDSRRFRGGFTECRIFPFSGSMSYNL